jgi:tetratricopeptide (TPR) repeat protein
MKTSMVADRAKAQVLIDAVVQRMMMLRGQGSHKEALDIYLQIKRTYPDWVDMLMLIDVAADCICLARWQDAIHYAQTALAHDTNNFVPYDALAHAYSKLGQWDKAGYYGLQALKLRDSRFGMWKGQRCLPKNAICRMGRKSLGIFAGSSKSLITAKLK